ncbi:MAG: histone H1 [Chloroflexota bacterium]|nr:histone H1 [Chloroflexota bacterium]
MNSLASRIAEMATNDQPPADDGKDPAAVALGRKGGLNGGHARAAKMTPEERRESAKKAAAARWGKKDDG